MSVKYLLFWMLSFYTNLWEMMNKAFLELDISPQNERIIDKFKKKKKRHKIGGMDDESGVY